LTTEAVYSRILPQDIGPLGFLSYRTIQKTGKAPAVLEEVVRQNIPHFLSFTR
jgi:hypothetical protein